MEHVEHLNPAEQLSEFTKVNFKKAWQMYRYLKNGKI